MSKSKTEDKIDLGEGVYATFQPTGTILLTTEINQQVVSKIVVDVTMLNKILDVYFSKVGVHMANDIMKRKKSMDEILAGIAVQQTPV